MIMASQNRILITGATGLLGTNLVSYLNKYEYNIATLARKGNVDYIFDLSNRFYNNISFENFKPNIIINLVALTSVDICQENPNSAYLANTKTVENLVDWIQKYSAECHLIHISTDQVYDGVGPHHEDHVSLTNFYAFSKYAGESAALRVPSTILRTNFIGHSNVAHRESLTDWLYTSLINKNHIQVLKDISFSPLSIKTLTEIIQKIIEKKPIGVFNLGSHSGMSKADFCIAFAESLKLDIDNISSIDSDNAEFIKAYRPKDMRLNCSKIEKQMSIKLPCLFDEIIKVSNEYNEIT